MKTFELVKLNDIVSFERKGLIYNAVVTKVTEKTFTLTYLDSWVNQYGMTCFYDKHIEFYKSSKKTHKNHISNALEITGNLEII